MVLLGFAAVFFSGFICGVAPLPIKFMRSFRYEHWGLLSSFLAFLAIPFAVLTILSFVSGSVGMVMMGALGSSVGFGASLAMQIVSAQSIGLLFGEWKGVERRYTRLMVAALALMLLGLAVISAGQGAR
ncbi:MAG: hypothetical protein IJQ73_01560 [Kiritimatiellae bacterium]|nr:hypothetical protein [Kiritimatiellia bacterium]